MIRSVLKVSSLQTAAGLGGFHPVPVPSPPWLWLCLYLYLFHLCSSRPLLNPPAPGAGSGVWEGVGVQTGLCCCGTAQGQGWWGHGKLNPDLVPPWLNLGQRSLESSRTSCLLENPALLGEERESGVNEADKGHTVFCSSVLLLE